MRQTARFLALSASAALTLGLVAACSSAAKSNSTSSKSPIVIGTSLSLTGDFSTDGQAFERGYKLWVHDVNAAGGLLGRKVELKVLNDASSTTQVVTNYNTLISTDHVNLIFGPFSSLLTAPSAAVAARNGYALIEGAGGAPSVFATTANKTDHIVFDVSYPVAASLVPFANWVKSLPASQRPKTAAYPMADDPFAFPPVQTAQAILHNAGIRTVYSKIFPEEEPDYTPAADNVAASHADMVVLGSTDVPTVGAFMKAFEQQHYTPKIFIAAAGPDQGAAFIKAVGKGNANGMMVPNGWYPGVANAASQKMVSEYVAKYGGTPSGVNADVAEAYGVGQTAAQAVKATNSVDNAKIIQYLHSGVTLQTILGPVKFDSLGRNVSANVYIFQWQGSKFVQVLPAGSPGSVKVVYPKPAWTS